jgi:hypothetical protein
MEQVLRARVPAQAGAWVEAKVKVEAGWAGHSQQARAVIVYVPTVEQRPLMLQGNLVIKRFVLSVVQK